MTRLTEALERGRAMPEQVKPVGPVDPVDNVARETRRASTVGEPVPNPWDLDDAAPAENAPIAPSAPNPWELDDAVPPAAVSSVPKIPVEQPVPKIPVEQSVPKIPVEQPAEASTEQHRFSEEAASKIAIGPQADTALVEQYRRLAAVLHYAQRDHGGCSVMVASAVPSEGKTLTATNLALTLSHSYQRRVLLIDADLRRPSVHDVFRLTNRSGLSECLKHPQPGRLPVQQVSPRLWVLTAGRPDPDPMAGLVSNVMKQLLADAAAEFDWVIVDTPPVGLLSDANLLAGMIDMALIVVSANTTPYPLVQRAVEAIGVTRVLGVVLNRADRSAFVDGYGYDGYYPAKETKHPRRRFGLGFFQKKSA